MKTDDDDEFKIDEVLKDIGPFGKYQFINYVLISIPICLSASFTLAYVFTAGDLNYRCEIPQCEDINASDYNTSWLALAVPFKDDKPSQCYRFAYNEVNGGGLDQCTAEHFDRRQEQKCDRFVYENDEKTILNEWNLTCNENKWKLSLVGTINTFGQLVCLPITGYVSDRFGRRFAFIVGILISGLFGLLRSFSWNYMSFLIFEFLDPALGSGLYSAGFILGLELVGPSYRIRGGIVISVFYAVGSALLGVFAMVTENWINLLRVIYIPSFLFVSYFWLIPESVRWLSANGKNEEAAKIILKAAKVNKRTLSESTLNAINKLKLRQRIEPLDDLEHIEFKPVENEEEVKYKLKEVLKYPSMMWRVANCSFCWLTNTFVYYGLSLNSVNIGGNKYTNFILVSLIEIPGFIVCGLLADRIGRKKTQMGSLIVSGIVCIITALVGQDGWLNLLLFLIGKFAITVSFTTLYTYTAELFPTNLRHSLMGICSMFGRIGSMIAPQTPLLESLVKSLPLFLYGGTGLLSGFLVIFFPETLNTRLPDTLSEAMVVGGLSKEENGIDDEDPHGT